VNLLITGGAGFIGSHLVDALLAAGHHVTALDDLSTGSLANLQGVTANPRFKFVQGSVCEKDTLADLVKGCDSIFHLAAAVGVQLIVDRPVHTISTNIHGTEVILELANAFRKKILITSTSEVYGKSTKVPFREDDDILLGSTRFSRWSYACSKMVDEFLALAYHAEFGLEVIICRPFNTIGPRQVGDYGMVVPRFVRSALENKPLEIFGTGEQRRCFCNVSDLVSALVKLMERPQAVGEVVNIGNTESITIRGLAEKVIALTGSGSELRFLTHKEGYGRPVDDMFERSPDITKAGQLIGFKPTVRLDETLRQIIAWERSRVPV
jgi:UDP-glucose 4-epimerase